MQEINILAEIRGIKYKPFLCRELNIFNFDNIEQALQSEASFILRVDGSQVAMSWWVSPKRTRSYPYARVYDTLGFAGKKVTIIPLLKDEGKDGDRDFLQWDTISLMSLLGVYVVISYYAKASRNPKFNNKITDQRFDVDYIKKLIKQLLDYRSDALHWNISQLDNIGEICEIALESYRNISRELNVEMHSWESAEKRIMEILKGKETFMKLSRRLAEKAQKRERVTRQPKEHLTGIKATLTVKNYLGGFYYFTCDEVEVHGDNLYLIEGKHSREKELPSIGDIKDGLLRMILFTNLENVKIEGKDYNPIPILKLTTSREFNLTSIKEEERQIIELLNREAKTNGFKIVINKKFLENYY
jgi:DNA-dependent RNA polymerase auxiliary subunit epsilon